MPAGEHHKTLRQAGDLLDWLTGTQIGRRDVLLLLGGGVVIDMGGFVASTYMRGVEYLALATTLIGQVDAGIGGRRPPFLGAGAGGEPPRRDEHAPAGRPRDAARRPAACDGFHRRIARRAERERVLREQGRRDRPRAIACDRARPEGLHGECGGPGPDRHAHELHRPRGGEPPRGPACGRAAAGASGPARAGAAARNARRGGRLFAFLASAAPSSLARSSRSTGASSRVRVARCASWSHSRR